MYPNPTSNGPASAGTYIPYFYQAGLYLRYGLAHEQAGLVPDHGRYTSYDFSSDRPLWSRHDDLQTVEQIIAHGYLAIPVRDSETALLSDKKDTAWLGLDDVIAQIRRRYAIYNQNTYELDLGVCDANNAVHRQEADQGAPANDRQRYAANKAIQGFYEQKRTERVNLWRDVTRARADLPESAQSYLAAHRKLAILESDPDRYLDNVDDETGSPGGDGQ